MTPTAPSSRAPFDPNAEAVVLRSFEVMGGSLLEEFHELFHPECVNHEAKAEPPAARGRGPEAMHATANGCRRRMQTSPGRSMRSSSSVTSSPSTARCPGARSEIS